jgi:hypothetical protein
MASNLQKELSIVPGVDELILWGATERNAA